MRGSIFEELEDMREAHSSSKVLKTNAKESNPSR